MGVSGQRGARQVTPGLGGRSKRSHALFTPSIEVVPQVQDKPDT
jgi:hypothetical protein